MRFLIRATIPVDAGNAMVRDPQMGKKMEAIMAELKPEAAYFTIESGQRTMYFVVNATDASQLPRLAEPLWLSVEADVEVLPVMTQEDLGKAMATIGDTVRKFG